MSTEITLTPAELDLIRIRREEAKLEEEKRNAETAAKHERLIRDRKSRMAEHIRINSAGVQQAIEWVRSFPAGWEVRVEEYFETARAEAFGPTGIETIWSETYKLQRAEIVYAAQPKYYVSIFWESGRKGKPGKHKMTPYGIDNGGRDYTNPKTVVQKYTDYFNEAKRKNDEKARKESATDKFVREASVNFPTAKITIGTESTYRTDYSRRTPKKLYTGETNVVKIELENGIVLYYGFDYAGNPVRKTINMETVLGSDPLKTLEVLNSLTKLS